MGFFFEISLTQWLLFPTVILDADDDGEGHSSVSIAFLCLCGGVTF